MDWVLVLIMACVAAYGLGFHHGVSCAEVWGPVTVLDVLLGFTVFRFSLVEPSLYSLDINYFPRSYCVVDALLGSTC